MSDPNKETAKQQAFDLLINLVDEFPGLLGDDGNKTITIDPDFWANASSDQREQLVFHELGHCALVLRHNIVVDSNRCLLSIIYPYAFGNSDCYKLNKDYYFSQLMNP
jgi:hypothetical protein